jgi:hypothetical protein
VVSFEETEEERKQRKLLKKQKLRREKDRALRRLQSQRRKQREEDLALHLKAIKEEQERERMARWGAIPSQGHQALAKPLREQDVPKQPFEATHPAFIGALRKPYPRKMLGEREVGDATFKSPVVFGYRVDYERLSEDHRLPLPSACAPLAP